VDLFVRRCLAASALSLAPFACLADDLRPAPEAAGSVTNLELQVYGISYHPDREGVRRNRVGNEANAGLGLSYEFHNDSSGAAFVEAGFYEDSGRNWAKLAGPGYQFKFGSNLRLGAILPVIQSRTYNNGRAFVAPIPLLTYDFGAVKLNAVFAPKFQQLNKFAVFGFYLGIPFGI
jgi:hypothetical protein